MEIPEINMISDFQAGMKCLQNPSFLSGIGKVAQAHSFWKWGALVFALVAAFTGVINTIKLLIVRFSRIVFISSSEPLLQHLNEDGFDDDFSDIDSVSSVSSDDGEEDEDESTASFEEEDQQPGDEDFSVAGSSSFCDSRWQNCNLKLRRRFSWSDFAAGRSVVKLWDSFGLGLDLEDCSGSAISVWDLNKDRKVGSFFGGRSQIPAFSVLSSSAILSAEVNNSSNVTVGLYDTRVGRQIPTVTAEWRQPHGKAVGINSGGVEKVYVRDDVTGALTVGDMRNVKTPLENLTESDGDIWWDADGAIVANEFADNSR
ncbi:uncharacterized protein LOC132302612 [Cornus florida]|uniref:uncharacterized protein LOC132302612 n=1 Tax=Cornus florida TaxID=4283 RepID=UPI0028972BC0|nr:uncharacterized protein LOC132302612 [Cornus florida]